MKRYMKTSLKHRDIPVMGVDLGCMSAKGLGSVEFIDGI
jgi:hypothetical protein